MFAWKDENKQKRGGVGPFFKKNCQLFNLKSNCFCHLGVDLHFLLLPIMVWETILDVGDHTDVMPGPVLVYPSLHGLEKATSSHHSHYNSLPNPASEKAFLQLDYVLIEVEMCLFITVLTKPYWLFLI